MSSRSINRKDFLVFTVSSAAITAFLEACGDDPATSPGTAGSAGSGTAGSGTAGTPATGGTGTAGTGTAGTGTAGTPAAGGTGTAGTGTGGASGGSAGNASGGKGGSGGASGGSGGASGGSGGTGGAGGGMCGTVTIMQTSAEQHDHIPNDATQLKADLKMHINGAMSTMEFTLPMDGNHDHKITLNVGQVMMLKGGGMVTMIKSTMDGQGPHSHTYTIGCTA